MAEKLRLMEKIPNDVVDNLIGFLTDLGYETQILEDKENLYLVWKSEDGHYYCATDYFSENNCELNAIKIGYLFNDDMFFDFSIKLPVNKRKITSVINKVNMKIFKTYTTKKIIDFLSDSDTYFQMWKQRCFVEKISREADDLEKILKSLGYTPERFMYYDSLCVAWKTNLGIYIFADIYGWTIGNYSKMYSKPKLFSLGVLNPIEFSGGIGFFDMLSYPTNINNVKESIARAEFYYKESRGLFCPINKQDEAYEKLKKDMLNNN